MSAGHPASRTLPLILAAAILLPATAAVAQQQAAVTIDDFDHGHGAWSPHPSDGVELRISEDAGRRGKAMRLDFDFHQHAGYAIARRAVDLDLPRNYEIAFWIRAEAPVNNLELKLVDASGDNVWWLNRRDFTFPREWREIVTKKRQISFAWGPLGGGEAKHIASMEIVVTAGTAGRGTVWIDDLTLVPRPANMPPPPAVIGLPWRGAGAGEQSYAFDMGSLHELSGLRIDWEPKQHARDYDVELSADGTHFEVVRRVVDSDGGRDWIWLPDNEARVVRLRMRRAAGADYAIRDLVIEPVDWAPTINDFFAQIAAPEAAQSRGVAGPQPSATSAKRNSNAATASAALQGASRHAALPGDYPRYLLKQQSYWTIVGADGGEEEALVGEDGNIEPFKGGFSIEPFIWHDGQLTTWADIDSHHALADGYLPVPTVTWPGRRPPASNPGGRPGRRNDIKLEVTAAVTDESTLYVRYRLSSVVATKATLFLAVRPFQVNPSSQWLNTQGGATTIQHLVYAFNELAVNGKQSIFTLTPPNGFGAATFDQGNIVDYLRRGALPGNPAVHDAFGHASGALAYAIELHAGESKDAFVAVPLNTNARMAWQPSSRGPDPFSEVAAGWRQKLTRVPIDIPAAPEVANTIRTSIAYMLINRDGPALQPGSRSYERAWIRDGALMSPSLLRLGQAEAVKEFARWYAPFQFDDGKVPCCVDRRGADPVPENDSHGELIFLVAEYYRYTHDAALVGDLWPHVDAAARYIDMLRQQRKTAAYSTDAKRAFFGLVPESISHEGYSAKPVHSYWDDFFCLAGLQDAAFLAGVLKKDDRAREIAASAADFGNDIAASIRTVIDQHHLDYVPGSADLADFDPSATSIAVAPLGLTSILPAAQLRSMFDRYLAEFRARRDDRVKWDVYTPYEMRLIDALAQRGRRADAHELLDFFMHDRRPPAWNGWAEVVPRDKRSPHFLGDMPHAWIASDFVRSVLDFFAFDDRENGSLVVGAGVPQKWVEGTSLHIGPMPTYSGTIDIAMSGQADQATVSLSGTATSRIVVKSPYERPVRTVSVNGRAARYDDGVVVTELPARVTLSY